MGFWGFIVTVILLFERKRTKSKLTGNVLLVIAHPDDEAMFFSPTVNSLTHNKNLADKPNIFVLCLTSGDFDGLGKIRKKELEKSVNKIFRIPLTNLNIIDSPDFPDGQNVVWSKEKCSKVITKYVKKWSIN